MRTLRFPLQLAAWLLLVVPLLGSDCNSGFVDDDSWTDDDDDDDDDDDTGTPDIDAADVDAGQVGVGVPGVAALVISNEGDGDLEIHYVTMADSAGHVIDVEPWHGHVEPGGGIQRTISINCVDPGERLGVIEIGSNDPDEPTFPVDVDVICTPTGG